jgi:hypothetical protein
MVEPKKKKSVWLYSKALLDIWGFWQYTAFLDLAWADVVPACLWLGSPGFQGNKLLRSCQTPGLQQAFHSAFVQPGAAREQVLPFTLHR